MASTGSKNLIRFSLGVFLGMSSILNQSPASADIRAGQGKSFDTKVNGQKGGRCSAGVCRISGGKKSGRSKFMRFKDFDTRGKIKRVDIDTGGKRNLVVGVTSPIGTHINKSIQLSSKANLYWLSPGGIHLGSGGGFVNVPSLNLSTTRSLRFGDGLFDVFKTRAANLDGLKGDPLSGSRGFGGMEVLDVLNQADDTVPVIQMEGIDIRIDRDLFADAPGGVVEVRESKISVGNDQVDRARLTLTGEEVVVGDGTELMAVQAGGGGKIEVGGSWQNSDETVRQAKRTVVEAGALLDASAGNKGDGGEIVVWSDISNPESVTIVSGSLFAKGGRQAGVGGQIETSGFELKIAGIDVDATANHPDYSGLWLLDPYDYTLNDNSPDFETSTIASVLSGGTSITLKTTDSSNAAGGNTIASDGTDTNGGRITIDDNIIVSGSGSGDLALVADSDIQINATLQNLTGDGDLTLHSQTGVTLGNSGAISWDPGSTGFVDIISSQSGGLSGSGSINISSGKFKVNTSALVPPLYTGSIALSSGTTFEKRGTGGFRLKPSSSSNQFNLIELHEGILALANDDALGTSYSGSIEFKGGAFRQGQTSVVDYSAQFSDAAEQKYKIYVNSDSGIVYNDALASPGGTFELLSGDLQLTGASTYSGKTTISAGSLKLVGSTGSIQSSEINVAEGATYELDLPTVSDQATYSGVISGSGKFKKSGLGELTLSGANTFSGNTSIDEGILLVSGSLSDSTVVDVASGATYKVGSNDTIGGLEGNGKVDLNGQSLTVNQAESTESNFAGEVSGGRNAILVKAGSGILTLSGENDIQQAIQIDDGILLPSAARALTDETDVIINSPGVLSLLVDTNIERLSGSGDVELASSTLSARSTTDTTFSGVMSGNGSFEKVGPAKLTFSGDNLYSGSTTIRAGTLSVSGSLDDSTVVDVSSGATYQLAASDTIGGLQGAGSVDLNSNTLTVQISNSDESTTFSGDISGSGSGSSLTKAGSGTLNLSGTLTYSGSTNVVAGQLTVTADSASTAALTATCSGSGTSNICSSELSNSISLAPTPEPTPEPEEEEEPEPTPEPTLELILDQPSFGDPGDQSPVGDLGELPLVDDPGGLPPFDDPGGLPPFDDTSGLPPFDDPGGLPPFGDPGGLPPFDDLGELPPFEDLGDQPPFGGPETIDAFISTFVTEGNVETLADAIAVIEKTATMPMVSPSSVDVAAAPEMSTSTSTASMSPNAPVSAASTSDVVSVVVATTETGSSDASSSVNDTVETVAASLVPSSLSAEGTSVDLSLGDSFQVAAVSSEGSSTSSSATSTVGVASATSESTAASATADVSNSEASSGSDTAAGSETSAAGESGEAAGETSDSANSSDDSAATDSSEDTSTEEGGTDDSADEADAEAGTEAEGDAEGEGEGEGETEGDAEGEEEGEGETEGDAEAGSDEEGEGSSEGDQGGLRGQESAPSVAVNVKRVDASQALAGVSEGDSAATDRAVGALNLPKLSGRRTPSAGQISNFLQQLRQQIGGVQ